jgi:hypothetical protein
MCDPNQHLACTWLLDVDVVDDEWLLRGFQHGGAHARTVHWTCVFVFFSNRLGCLGSLLVSLVVTLLVLLLLRVL